ncbi:AGL245Cp [Eremothecium gossypii ATCC 10895]|uniref:Nascent polypeptide-associated complex subunit beta n=1 Tax=Eremothecium gossypii (strain ATCC 10895 / CBS 109.51 / FGSC 9923 / NRRL Y-1056) TaxID=284811 RepID=NACB_EREGS|nr:AGL245Cp [Eremothecium gossypii ATCC 10895]Q751F1.1 RecName: Full=Nascent polypeptide-associated complex subunit beta; Short=NAC-beta; AltName: Full=Beta-NAC [Eremothecium gossypii ATCC 10895]AAS54246.1 AGL245Cp [Eremothecium gossypii ATCC 10895]AEY98572.1 FAGL245Cp [Eremothecium gossypii FDAG1]
MPIDQEKLAKLQKLSANNKVGGTRRKLAKKSGTASANKDDSKLQAQLAKLKAVTMDQVEEANFFKDDGSVLHFNKVGVQVAPQHNTSVFYGIPQEKSLQDLFPSIIPQLGSESIDALTQLATQLQNAQAAAPATEGHEAGEKKDNDIPELIEGQSFDADVE